ncbi:MAG: hypothetical protein S4CHLAM45_09800 [Chlamydiales bacterium]|nr:hypothetical protein [Chlamydiales bacterium]MCH9620202.1 hypothetical protein [Chlamydiales bacterium]MCH9623083.1 hypothetical protein [Chlamydiales bacterium]
MSAAVSKSPLSRQPSSSTGLIQRDEFGKLNGRPVKRCDATQAGMMIVVAIVSLVVGVLLSTQFNDCS